MVKNILIKSGDIFYVGKGYGKRAYSHIDDVSGVNPLKEAAVARIRMSGCEPIVEIIKDCIDEKMAFLTETVTIKKTGRLIDGTGTLTNLTLGGEGVSEITCNSMRETKPRGKSWYNDGYNERLFIVGEEIKGYNRGRICNKP